MEKLTFEIHDSGIQVYRNQAGQFHNPVGPAIIWSNEKEEYWLNDNLHNEDGPAVIRLDGTGKYYLNGKHLSKEEWEKQVKQVSEVKEVTMTELHELLGYPVKIKED